MPMRLWSTVVEPRDEPGRRRPARSRRSVDVRPPCTSDSPGTRAGPGAVGPLRPRAGILFPGFRCCGSRIQPREVLGACSAAGRRASERRLARCVRSGPTCRSRSCRGSCGSTRTPTRGTPAGRARLGRAGGCGAAGDSRAQPRVERRPRLGDHEERHVRVLQPAELGALPAVDARLVGVQRHTVRLCPGSCRSSGSAPAPRSCG